MSIIISDLIRKYISLPNSDSEPNGSTPEIVNLFEKYQKIPLITDYSMFKELSLKARVIPIEQLPKFKKIFENVINRLDSGSYLAALEEKQYDLSAYLIDKQKRVCNSKTLARKLIAHFEKGVDLNEFFPYMIHAIKKVINGADIELITFVDEVCFEALKTPGMKVKLNFADWKSIALQAPKFSHLRAALTTPQIEIIFKDLPIEILDRIAPYAFPDNLYRFFPFLAIYQLISNPNPYEYLLNALESNDLQAFNILLSLGLEPNARNENQFTILHAAVGMGNYSAVKILLDHRANPNHTDGTKTSPLMIACCKKHAEIARLLCERGAKNLYNNQNHSAFHSACYCDSLACLKILVEFFDTAPLDVSEKLLSNGNLLSKKLVHIAALKRNYPILNYLIQNGCSLLAKDHNGDTALHYAANGWVDGVELIIQSDQRTVRLNNKLGNPPIFSAIEGNHLTIFNLLLPRSEIKPKFLFKAVLTDPSIFMQVVSRIGWPQLVDAKGNTPLHLLIMSYISEENKENFRLKFNRIPQTIDWLAANDAGETPYELALLHVREYDILSKIVKLMNFQTDKTSPLLLKPLQSLQAFANPEIAPMVVTAAYHAIVAAIPHVKRTILKQLEPFPENEVWVEWIEREIKKVHQGEITGTFLKYFNLALKSERELFFSLLEIDQSHFFHQLESSKLPEVDEALPLAELELLFQRWIEEKQLLIYYDPDEFGQSHLIPLPILKDNFRQMMRIIKNREDYTGVPKGDQKEVFYDRLDRQIRLLIQSIKDPSSDPEKVDSCIADLARGACYCAKRWMDESFAHVRIFYHLEDQALGIKEAVLHKLHEARLAIIEEISRIGYPGNWTHNEVKFRNMLKNVRGIYDEVTAYDDPLGVAIPLAELLYLFDAKYNSHLAVTVILQMINDSQLTLEKKTLIQADLRDFVSELTKKATLDKAQNLLKELLKMVEERSSWQQIRSYLMENNIFWNESQFSHLQEQSLEILSEKLQDEVAKSSFDEIHDSFFEKYPGSEIFEGYRQYNKNGVEYPQEILNDQEKAPKPSETFTHYGIIAALFLLMKQKAVKVRLPNLILQKPAPAPPTPIASTPVPPSPATPSTPTS